MAKREENPASDKTGKRHRHLVACARYCERYFRTLDSDRRDRSGDCIACKSAEKK